MNKNSMIIFISLITIFCGILLFSSNYLESKIDKSFNNMNLKLLAYNDLKEQETIIDEGFDEGTITETEEQIEEIEEIKETNKKQIVDYDYVGKIIIPKINLERGFVAINSKYNSINYGIQTHKLSTYPNQKNGNLILLSHSGTSYRSFFKNLYKLELGDECYIEYQGVKYKFTVKKIYNMPKIGKVVIDRDYNKTSLTLITCTHNSKTEQTIYILELV